MSGRPPLSDAPVGVGFVGAGRVTLGLPPGARAPGAVMAVRARRAPLADPAHDLHLLDVIEAAAPRAGPRRPR